MPRLLHFILLLPLLASVHADSLKPQIKVADASSRFTVTFTDDASVNTRYYAVHTSTDLDTWQYHYFRYNPRTQQTTQPTDGKLEVAIRPSIPEVTAYELSFAPTQRLFVRLEPLAEAPEGQRFLTEETHNLLANLHRIGWDPEKIIFGQEFPLSYSAGSNTGNGELEDSDSNDIVGQHPGVHGVDFLYMIDRPWEEDFHKAAAREAYEDGTIVTIDYHWLGKYGDSFYVEDERDLAILQNVVNNDDSSGDVTWFYDSLDRILEIINNDLRLPFVFRPLHENNGNWFWWGSRIEGGPEVYQQAYRLIVSYLSERSDYILFAWSPDKDLATEYYPGDEYVDMIGIDLYGAGAVSWLSISQMVSLVEDAVDFAETHGKVAAITETGYASESGSGVYYDSNPDWWMNHHLNPILESETARKIAWALTWINASWSGPYIPHEGAPQAAIDDFQAYFEHPVTLFQSEVAALKVYSPPPNE